MNNISGNPNINKNTGGIGRILCKTASDLSNSKALAPVILLEASVIGGRCYHANKRGGIVELRERFMEEVSTALVWFFGIYSLNEIGDFLAKKFLKLDTKIEFGQDKIPDEYGKLKKYLKNPLDKLMEGKSKSAKDMLVKTKFAKILLSSLIGIYVVGSIIPKFKNSFTANNKSTEDANFLKSIYSGIFKKKNIDNVYNQSDVAIKPSINNFLEHAKDNNNLSFKNSSGIRTLCHKLENDNIYKLLTIDAGIVAGRSLNARNDDERIEIIFRDIASIYFYMFSTHQVANFLADKNFNFFGLKLKGLGLDSKTATSTKLDPVIVDSLNNILSERFDNSNKSISEFNIFLTDMFGKANPGLVDKLKTAAKNNSDRYTLDMDEFEKIIKESNPENTEKILNIAKKFAEFNSHLSGETGKGFIVSAQIEDIVRAGCINEPDFVKNLFYEVNPKLKDPRKFVPLSSIDETKENIYTYADGLKAHLEKIVGNKELTREDFQKALTQYGSKNLFMKILYLVAGLGVSAYFLSSGIPKLQYYITKMRTGNEGFPGVEE